MYGSEKKHKQKLKTKKNVSVYNKRRILEALAMMKSNIEQK